MSNHQRANGPSHHHYHRRERNNPGHAPDYRHPNDFERQSPYPPPPQDPHPYPRRNSRPRDRYQDVGYGGRRSSSSPERGSRGAPPLRDPNSYRLRHSNSSPPRDPDRLYSNDPFPTNSRNSIDSPPRPTYSNNTYTGGCPYTKARPKIRERKLAQPESVGPPDRPPPLSNKSRDNSSHHHRDTRHLSGPYKSVCSSISPVKPTSFRPRITPATSSCGPQPPGGSCVSSPGDSSLDIPKLQPPMRSDSLNRPALIPGKGANADRRSSRTMSFEKNEAHLSNQRGQQRFNASFRYAAIAHPNIISTENVGEIARRHDQVQQAPQNGTLPKRFDESSERETKSHSGETERAGNSQHESVQQIFNKAPFRAPSRVPKVPEGESSAANAPAAVNKGDTNELQSKEETGKSARGPVKMKPPLLRSVPAPPRRPCLDDTPQRRAAAAALQRANQKEKTGDKLRGDYSTANGGQGPNLVTSGSPYDSEARRSTNSPERSATRQRIASSMAKMNIEGREENCSASGRELNQEGVNHDIKQKATSDEHRKGYFLLGGNRDPQISKRRVSDFDGRGEPPTKRLRSVLPSETVCVDSNTTLRRCGRFQQPETPFEEWETARFVQDRVHNLFLEQLMDQPMLLRISFLGMSDGDFRATLDLWKGDGGLPRADGRRLEVNNNRVRSITNDMCLHILALKVVTLNLSCNLLTTIGAKIGLCSKLKFLNVSRNRLSSLPQELCDLTNLEVLNMSHNEISRLPSGLCRLKRLEVLSLAWNKLEVLPEDVAAEGAVLSDLDLSHNEGFHFFPRCAEHWMKLEVLHMSSTRIFKSLSRREQRLRPADLVKELAGRRQDMFNSRKMGLRSRSV